jgi:hypothetical protein
LIAVLLLGVIFTACDSGSSGGGGRPEILPSAYKTMDYEDWNEWLEDNESAFDGLSEGELENIADFIESHFEELTAGGQQFWTEIMQGAGYSIVGSVVTPQGLRSALSRE